MRGIDVNELFWSIDATAAFDIIDNFIVEDALTSATVGENALEKVRTSILSAYNRHEAGRSNDDASGSSPGVPQPIRYTDQTEDGYVGLEAPLG